MKVRHSWQGLRRNSTAGMEIGCISKKSLNGKGFLGHTPLGTESVGGEPAGVGGGEPAAECVCACLRVLAGRTPAQVCEHLGDCGDPAESQHKLPSAVCLSASLSHHPHPPARQSHLVRLHFSIGLGPCPGLGGPPAPRHSLGILCGLTRRQAHLAPSSGFC